MNSQVAEEITAQTSSGGGHSPETIGSPLVMGDDGIVAPPAVCGYADAELAHDQMRRHRECRLDRCVWKAAAYHTLIEAGCLAPQSLTPRERAAARGIAYPPLRIEVPAPATPTVETLRQVLDRLSELAMPLDCSDTADGHGVEVGDERSAH